jgi:putative ABC transport system permease protein
VSPARLVLRNVRRNLGRSIITGLLLFVFMFIFSILAGILATVSDMRNGAADSLRLGVSQKYAGAWKSEMPGAYAREVGEVPGVRAASGMRFIGGSVKSEDDFIFGYAVDADTIRDVRFELKEPATVSESDWRAFASKREAVLVGFRALSKHGWRVGQRAATIKTWGNLPQLRFDIVGTLHSPEFSDTFLIHLDYMEHLIHDEGKVEQIGVRVGSAAEQDRVSRAIESHFQGRPVQVVVRTDKAFMRNILDMMGDFYSVLVLLAAVVFSTCFLMTMNSLSMSIRERTTEIALYRAFGFSNLWIARLAVAEAGLLAGFAGTAGAFGAFYLFKLLNLQIPIGFSGSLDIPLRAALSCSGLAFALGAAAAMWALRPAFKAPVADVLRKVV